MRVLTRIEVKSGLQTKRGELIRSSDGRTGLLAVVLGLSQETGATNVLCLQSGDGEFKGPSLDRIQLSDDIASYGSEWVVAATDGDHSYPYNNQHAETLGVIRIHRDKIVMLVGGVNNRLGQRTGLFDLETLQVAPGERHHGAPCASWKLWASESEVGKSGAEPIMTFGFPKN